ncbi:MAG: UPF0182 family protein [Gemmatimonadetes bacterium]|nr:UPF0182 family protein [Gemmatimonadota bacterium]
MARGGPGRLIWFLAAGFAALVLLGGGAGLLADLLWFQEQGQGATFWRFWQARVLLRLVLAAIYALVFFVNLRVAARSFGSIRRRIANIEIHEAVKPLHLNVLAALASLGLALLFTAPLGRHWARWLLFLHPTPFGVRDPVFDRDVAFYVFQLPFYQFLQTHLLVLVVLSGLVAGMVYLTSGALELSSRHVFIRDRPRAHLAALAAAMFLVLGWGYWLDAFDLVHSSRGVVHGASWTDVHAQLPAYRALVVVALVAAAVALRQVFRGDLRRVGYAAAVLFAGAFLFKVLLPGAVQRFVVEPDEIRKESPYIAHNIRLTRRAFGLDAIERRRFPLARDLNLETLAASRGDVQSIRLWDWRPLLQTYAQLQEIRLYYGFADVDVDRYPVGGQTRQVMLSVREMRAQDLASNAQTWQNVHLVYTHGYGLVLSPVDEVSAEGLPNFFIRDIPPVVAPEAKSPALEIRRPEIYFGEETEDYAVVNTKVQEFDYPRGDENAYASYRGRGGVQLDAAWKRLLFAWRFGTLKLVLADAITDRSRILYDRSVAQRVRKLAPFLLFDSDPYPAIHEGRIVWIQDAYTATSDYPYSEPVGFGGTGLNYIRNSVKAVVDAYDGSVRFYVFDERDPILASWRRILPGLFLPGSAMPAGLRAHVRYPEDLFTLQSLALRAYHMRDPKVFYNKEDFWNLPSEIYQETPQPMEPYYVVLRLPGEARSQFMLVLPFTPSGKDNMVALLAAKSDGEDYGELVLYEFPKDELIYGPMQIEARIDQDSRISQQITLWSQKGSTVIRGNLLVIPLEGALLYIEPLFLQAQKSQLPELKQVIGAYGSRIAMHETLDETLTALLADREPARGTRVAFGEESAQRSADRATDPEGKGALTATGAGREREDEEAIATGQPGGRVPAAPGTAAEQAERALAAYRAAIAAQRAGDWAEYGQRLRDLGDMLEGMQAAPR